MAKPEKGPKKIRLKILRQEAPEKKESRRWDTFEVDCTANMTVHEALEKIRRSPVTTEGKTVSPPAWEAACLEDVCGACAMLVNGKVAQACSLRVEEASPKGKPIVLEPLKKFTLERDLVVDRTRVFDGLKRVKAWIALEGTAPRGPGPVVGPDDQAERYALSRCTACGLCLEACPEVRESGRFVGAAAIGQARLFEIHPTGALHSRERTESLMEDGGVADCGKAQNCVEVCPAKVPLIDAIGEMSRATTKRLLFGWLLK